MPEITFTCSEDDASWLAEQAEQLGIDDIGITVRVVVRNARQRNQSFGIVANGAGLDPIQYQPRKIYSDPAQRRTFETALPQSPEAFAENAAATDLEVPADEVEAALAEASDTISEALAPARAVPVAMAQPSSTYRSRASALRNQPALRVLDGPGSRTAVVDAGELARTDPRLLSPSSQVAAENLQRAIARGGHFARKA